MKILVVDDDEIALALIKAALETYGYTNVTTVQSGMAALEEISRNRVPFDCLLLDYRMPGVDGANLCSQIRKFRDYRDAPIIFVTAVTEREAVKTAYAAGAIDYVSKPIDPLEIGIRVSFAEKHMIEERASASGRPSNARFPSFDFPDPVPILGVDGVLRRRALENYLATLGHGVSANCSVSVISINSAESIFRNAGPGRYYVFMSEIAREIVESLKRSDTLISYAGSGQFLCVSKNADLSANPGVARLINNRIARLNLTYDDQTACLVMVSIGKPAQSAVWSGADAPVQLIEKALELNELEDNFARSDGRLTPSSIRALH